MRQNEVRRYSVAGGALPVVASTGDLTGDQEEASKARWRQLLALLLLLLLLLLLPALVDREVAARESLYLRRWAVGGGRRVGARTGRRIQA